MFVSVCVIHVSSILDEYLYMSTTVYILIFTYYYKVIRKDMFFLQKSKKNIEILKFWEKIYLFPHSPSNLSKVLPFFHT